MIEIPKDAENVRISKNSNALIGDKIYFFETKEEEKLAIERDNIIDRMIAIQDNYTNSFPNYNQERLLNAVKKDRDWLHLRLVLSNKENKLKKTCSYLSPEDSIKWEQGRPISDDQIIKQLPLDY